MDWNGPVWTGMDKNGPKWTRADLESFSLILLFILLMHLSMAHYSFYGLVTPGLGLIIHGAGDLLTHTTHHGATIHAHHVPPVSPWALLLVLFHTAFLGVEWTGTDWNRPNGLEWSERD